MAERRKAVDAGAEFASAAALAMLLIVSALRYGMYFDVSLYRWEAAMLLAGAISFLYRCFGIAGPAMGTGKGAGAAAPLSFGYTLALWPLLLSALFVLGLAFDPASTLGTWNGALRWAGYAAFLYSLETWFTGSRSSRPFTAALQAAAAFIIWGSLAGWLGWFRFPDFVMVSGDARLTAVGARLAGYFQYANMLGAVLGALLLLQLVWLAGKRSDLPLIRRFAGLLAAPAMTALLLTESRGAWLAAAAGWAVGLAVHRGEERRGWALHSGWAVLAGASGYGLVVGAAADIGSAEGSGTGIPAPALSETALLLSAAAIAWLGHELLGRMGQKTGARAGLSGWLAIAGLAISAVYALYRVVGRSAAGRVIGHFETAAARRLFYEDGLALLRESPWIGYGGNSWRALHRTVQSRPYVGNEVHSGYLDMALNIGLPGLLVLLVFVGLIVLRVWRGERAGLAPLAVLLLHPAVDLDMSFGFYWLLLLCLAVLFGRRVKGWSSGGADAVCARGGARSGSEEAVRGTARIGEAGIRARERRAEAGRSQPAHVDRSRAAAAVRVTAALLAAALLCTAAAAAWRLDRARAASEAASAAHGAAREHALRHALEANPAWTRIRLELAALAPLRERMALLEAGLRYEPQSVPLVWELGRNAAELGDERRAAAYMRLALERDRFDKAKQTEAVVLLARLAKAKLAAGDSGRAREAAQSALELYERYEALASAVRAMGQAAANGRRFGMTDAARQAAEDGRRLLAAVPSASTISGR